MGWWDPTISDEERAALRSEMLEERPDLDLENLLMGERDGPASPDRPDLPVWEYRSFVQSTPSVALQELAEVRFPILHFEGTPAVTSVAEELKPFPRSYKGRQPNAVYVIDAESIVRRYEMEFEAGLQEWDHDARGIVQLLPLDARRPVLEAWVKTLQRAAEV